VSKPVQNTTFRSGVAARLAGIPVETLRVWERRYRLTGNSESPGRQRLYGKDDIERLAMLKRLVDLGQSIGSIAQLDMTSLLSVQESLVNMAMTGEGDRGSSAPRVALIGPILGADITQTAIDGIGVDVISRATSFAQFKDQYDAPQLDAMLIEVPTLLDNVAHDISEFAHAHGVGKVILFYRFAPNTLIRKLRGQGHSIVRMPFDIQEVAMLCKAILDRRDARATRAVAETSPDTTHPPKFSTETLLRLTQMKSSVYCECPSQLAELLISISAFERYSAQCASQTPEDAALHQQLEHDAARARSILEASITAVIQHENISIERTPST
jgi:MerR family transcriptional regulator, light-induced transcriptional regulator